LPPGQVDAIHVTAWSGDRSAAATRTFDLAPGSSSAELPGRLALVPDDPARASRVQVEAVALKAGKRLLTREAALSFQPGSVRLLRLDLLATCLCLPKPCASNQTCGEGGECVAIDQEVDALPRYQPRTDAGARIVTMPGACPPPHGGADGGDAGLDAGTGDVHAGTGIDG